MYELGIRVKECREDGFHPFLYFFVAGDFLKTNVKASQPVHRWQLIFKSIDLEELFSQGSQKEKSEWLTEQLINNIPGGIESSF